MVQKHKSRQALDLQVIWWSPRLSQSLLHKLNFECKINGWAFGLGAHFWGQASTNTGVPKSAAVPAARLLAATCFLCKEVQPLLQYWLSLPVWESKKNNFWHWLQFCQSLFYVKIRFPFTWRELVTVQSSKHQLAQSFNHSKVSE